MATQSKEILRAYLQDAIAAEKSFETQLNTFAEEATDADVAQMFRTHAVETRQQYEILTSRLHELGGEISNSKSFLARMFNIAPKAAQLGHSREERMTQDLMMAFSVENAEVAMYECLAIVATEAGDVETAGIARNIQEQERDTARKIWPHIRPAARHAAEALAGIAVG